MWERNNREEEKEQVEIMTEGREEGKPVSFGKDSRKPERQIGNLQEGGNANLKGRKSKFNTSQKQVMAVGRFRRKTYRDRKDTERVGRKQK